MDAPAVILTMVVAVALQDRPKDVRAGTAVPTGDGGLCMSMPAPVPTPGEDVILADPAVPQSWRRATVVGPVAVCQPLARAMIAGPYYALSVVATPDPMVGLFIALPRSATVRSDPPDPLLFGLSAAHRYARIDSCASNEGVHLRIWAGAPGASTLLWHEYYYVNYDLEPTCRF